MKISEVLRKAEIKLMEADIEEAKLKAKLLLLSILNISKEEYIIIQDDEIEDEKEIIFLSKIEELKIGRPLEYIIGKAYFLENEYIVNENVLIPRLDTEVLVNKAIEIIKNNGIKKVLEIGTGSGAIGIHLVKNTDTSIIATDISEEALEIAKLNAESLDVDFNRYELVNSDIYEKIGEKFDLIISNPPYIRTDEIKDLNKDVQREPVIALDGGKDGLDFYRQIINGAAKHINGYGSFIILEIGSDLADDIVQILESNEWKDIEIFKDYSGLNRMIVAEI